MIPVHISVLESFLFFLREKVTVETPVRKIMTALDISRSKHFRTKTIPKIVHNCNVAQAIYCQTCSSFCYSVCLQLYTYLKKNFLSTMEFGDKVKVTRRLIYLVAIRLGVHVISHHTNRKRLSKSELYEIQIYYNSDLSLKKIT